MGAHFESYVGYGSYSIMQMFGDYENRPMTRNFCHLVSKRDINVEDNFPMLHARAK